MNDTILCGVATLPSDQMDLHNASSNVASILVSFRVYRLSGDSFSATVGSMWFEGSV